VILCASCEEPDAPRDAGNAMAQRTAEADPVDPYDQSRQQLRESYRDVSARAQEQAAAPEAVPLHQRAAFLARMLALRFDEEAMLARAQEHLREASRRKAFEGACESMLDLARLLARDAGDPAKAYEVAYRLTRSFRGENHANCVREARRILSVLDSYRPSTRVLAELDVDPDADDPTATVDPGASLPPQPEVERWARDRGELVEAELERVLVYGASDGGRNAPSVIRVVLYFDQVALFRRGELAAEDGMPRRAFVDLRNTTLGDGVPRSQSVGAAGLVRIRSASFDQSTTRVVFDLEPEARYRLFFLSDPYRILFDFERPDEAAVADSGGPEAPRVIVLDPGHGGNEYGARHGGLTESVLTLDLSKRVAAILRRRLPRASVVLTRQEDRVLSLEQRVAFANALRADLFVSIHLNAADEPVDHGGVTTFVLDTTNDRQAMRLAARENGTSSREVTGLQMLLANLHREGQSSESTALAESVQRRTVEGGRRVLPHLPDRGVKSAMFYVLVGARMPSILLEASFLTEESENRALATNRYRRALAEGIAEGIVDYSRSQ